MGMYMYPITIKRESQVIHYSNEYELEDDPLTLKELRKYVSEDESFSIYNKEEGLYLLVSGSRLETKEEVEMRVKGEEGYMKNYNEFHSKHKTGIKE